MAPRGIASAGSLKLALRVLRRRKFFTFVSLFGTSFTLAVLLVVAAGFHELSSAGPPEVNLDRTLTASYFVMAGGDNEWSGNPGFRLLDHYLRDLPGVEEMAIASGRNTAVSFPRGERQSVEVRAVDGAYFRVLAFHFLAGLPLDDEDDALARPVAVLSQAAARRLVGSGEAVGSTIELDGRRFRVKGVVENVSIVRDMAYSEVWVPIGTIPGSGWRDRLMGDFGAILLAGSREDFAGIKEACRERLATVQFPDPKQYDHIDGEPLTRIESIARELMGLRAPRPSLGGFFAAVTAAALLFMALPAINLVNVNVSRIGERAGEIGVRKAFGAATGDLVGQFVVENVVLCLVGGAIGLGVAGGVLAGLNRSGLVPHADFQLSFVVAAWAVGLSVIFGVLSGAYPAWRMARLHPVDALRGGAL